MIPKAELHVHIEGSMPPSLVTEIALRNKITIPKQIFGPRETFVWKDFLDFLKVYDVASAVLRNAQDYRDMVYHYLQRAAKEGAIYVEMMISPDHATLCGVSYEEHLAGSIQGIKDAKNDFDIEGRLIMTAVRHFGVEACIKVAEKAALNPSPYVVGFGLGGDEMHFPPGQFVDAYKIAQEAGLGCTVHAGEMVGPEGVWEAITHLPVTRLGHGVRSIEDSNLLHAIIERDIALEVCPGSNIALGVYPDFDAHPFLKLKEAGVKVTLSSDDPPYFSTTLANEYDIAKRHFSLSDEALLALTRTSIEVSYADPQTKKQLLQKL